MGLLLIGLLQNKIFKAICDKRVLVEMMENDWGDFEKGVDLFRGKYTESIVHI